MASLHLKGYLCKDSNNMLGLNTKKKENREYWEQDGESIIANIEDFAKEYGIYKKHNNGLGGRKTIIDDCNLRVYFTDVECELEEAMFAFDNLLYGGDIYTKVNNVGYSEYTITGLELEKFTIGGHSLTWEFEDHIEQYCHILIDCD